MSQQRVYDGLPKGQHERATATADTIRAYLPESLKSPKIAIICGSGLGGLANTIDPEPRVELPYSQIDGFPVSTGMYS